MDFSKLTDDQLVELIRASCQEAVRRGTAVEAAARHAMLSEAEKAQIARTAAFSEAEKLREKEAERIAREAREKVKAEAAKNTRKQEADKQQRLWAKKKALALMVINELGSGQKLTVWERDGDKRVYIDYNNGSRNAPKVSYFQTGNHYNPPGTLKIEQWEDSPDRRAALLEICQKACKDWRSANFDCDEAAAANVEVSV